MATDLTTWSNARSTLLYNDLLACVNAAGSQEYRLPASVIISASYVDSYGADPTGVSDSNTAFANMLSDVGYINLNPAGEYLLTSTVTGTNTSLTAGKSTTLVWNGSVLTGG